MTKESILVLRADKVARIIENISERSGVSLEVAAEIYYNSDYCQLIEDKVADLHCRSEKYLASIILEDVNS